MDYPMGRLVADSNHVSPYCHNLLRKYRPTLTLKPVHEKKNIKFHFKYVYKGQTASMEM